MPRAIAIPSRELIGPDTPLRLEVAAVVAYPDGSMTASGLRGEHRQGRLVIERVAGKTYTTLAAIEKMRELCRLAQKAPGSTSGTQGETRPAASPIPQPGSSETDRSSKALAAALMTLEQLSNASPSTSPESTSRKRRKPANVVRVKFR